jgi:asparagine synthase (glutamine-hydrolysing)
MCGIAGVMRQGPAQELNDEVAGMVAALVHRGPDGEGILVRDGVALGHRRLAIIDLEGGRQPLANEDGSVWVVFNGEIYNYRELRAQLEARGHVFATHSDTEVIVHAYEEWGPESVARFRGMFGFALADFSRRRLLLARDPFGIKPLFYRIGPDYFAFASELSALEQVRAPAPRGRLEAVEHYLRYRYIPGPRTIYEDVFQLPPASWMTVDFDGQRPEPRTYWRLSFEPQHGLSDAQWLDRFEAVIHDSVRAHLVADVPFGVFLSGGIDSTLVARAMSDLLERPVTAFSIGFDEDTFTELTYAEEAAHTLGIPLCAETVTLDVAHLLPELVAHYGQPFADTSMIPTWAVSRLARRHVPMVLSGDGGDEAFAGYPRYANWVKDGVANEIRQLLASPRGLFWRVPRILKRLSLPPTEQRALWDDEVALIPSDFRSALWRTEHQHVVRTPCPTFARAVEQARPLDRLSAAQYVDYQTYLPGDILTKVDVASMYHGLEVRTPLIDVPVVELAASLPFDQRFRRENGNLVQKRLPKQSLQRRFAPRFVHRAKMGFGIPEDRWLRPGAPARHLFEELVLSSGSRLWEWFRRETVESWLWRMDRMGFSLGGPLWGLLILALWLEQHPDVTFAADQPALAGGRP